MSEDLLRHVPDGYTADEWAGVCEASRVLDDIIIKHSRPGREKPPRDIGVEIPETEPVTFHDGHFKKAVPTLTYIIRCSEYVKIGIAADVRNRLRTLEAANPMPLTVVAVLAGGRPVERALHLRFAAHRHRDEWFRIEGDLADWIADGCPASPPSDGRAAG